jgi:hypothetical protein
MNSVLHFAIRVAQSRMNSVLHFAIRVAQSRMNSVLHFAIEDGGGAGGRFLNEFAPMPSIETGPANPYIAGSRPNL